MSMIQLIAETFGQPKTVTRSFLYKLENYVPKKNVEYLLNKKCIHGALRPSLELNYTLDFG